MAGAGTGRIGKAVVVFLRAAAARRDTRQGIAGAASARPAATQRPSYYPRRMRAHLDGMDERSVPLDGHAGAREHQPLPLDGPWVSRLVSLSRPAPVRAARRSMAAPRSTVCLRDDAACCTVDLPRRRGSHRGALTGP